jgi:VanZ family protein
MDAPDGPRASDLVVVGAFFVVLLVVPWLMARGPGRISPPKPAPDQATPPPATLFSSARERRLWLYALAVILAIYSTLSPAQQFAAELRARGLLGPASATFLLGVAAVLALQWAKTRPGRIEIGAGVGVAAVYLTTVIRLPVPEARSHLFEYGLLAMLIHQALAERRLHGRRVPVPPLLALGGTAALGWLDEVIQAFLPNRVYDLWDVGLNAAFASMAIVASLFMEWARRWDGRRRSDRPPRQPGT